MNQESRNTGKSGRCQARRDQKNLRKSAKICESLSYIAVFLIDLYG
jgi:hypothetical protein